MEEPRKQDSELTLSLGLIMTLILLVFNVELSVLDYGIHVTL